MRSGTLSQWSDFRIWLAWKTWVLQRQHEQVSFEYAGGDVIRFLEDHDIIVNYSNQGFLTCLHPRSDAYSAEQVLLNKQQIWCGGAYLDCYLFANKS